MRARAATPLRSDVGSRLLPASRSRTDGARWALVRGFRSSWAGVGSRSRCHSWTNRVRRLLPTFLPLRVGFFYPRKVFSELFFPPSPAFSVKLRWNVIELEPAVTAAELWPEQKRAWLGGLFFFAGFAGAGAVDSSRKRPVWFPAALERWWSLRWSEDPGWFQRRGATRVRSRASASRWGSSSAPRRRGWGNLAGNPAMDPSSKSRGKTFIIKSDPWSGKSDPCCCCCFLAK